MPGYKEPPGNSIQRLGGLEPYINVFFEKRNLPYTYKEDVVPLFRLKGLTSSTKARQLGISKTAFENWERIYRSMNL